MECPVDDLIAKLQKVKKDFGHKGYSNFAVEMEDEWGYYDDHWINFVIYADETVNVKKFIDDDKQCITVK